MSKSDKEKSQRLEELRAEIQHHDELYYRQAQPEISDQQYDQKKRELDNLQAELDPLGLFAATEQGEELDTKTDVGDDRLEAFTSHRHLQPMLSLDNTYDEKEFFEFDQRLQRIFSTDDLIYVVEPKIDGVAISLTYKNGKLITATTRGNGVEGDIVTQNILHIEGLPQFLPGSSFPELIEIRGEIFMSHNEFERINKEREKRISSLCQSPQPRCWYRKITRPQRSQTKKARDRALWAWVLPAPNFLHHSLSVPSVAYRLASPRA